MQLGRSPSILVQASIIHAGLLRASASGNDHRTIDIETHAWAEHVVTGLLQLLARLPRIPIPNRRPSSASATVAGLTSIMCG